MKAFPTADEVARAGSPDVGAHLIKLSETDPEGYHKLLVVRATRWGHSPSTPLDRCVLNLCELLVARADRDHSRDDGKVDAEEARDYLEEHTGAFFAAHKKR